MSKEEYKKAVINYIKKMYPQKEFNDRFEKYMTTDEFQQDISNNYRDDASVSACAYNLWMWV